MWLNLKSVAAVTSSGKSNKTIEGPDGLLVVLDQGHRGKAGELARLHRTNESREYGVYITKIFLTNIIKRKI